MGVDAPVSETGIWMLNLATTERYLTKAILSCIMSVSDISNGDIYE
jgi:hypothetical protein